jgi:hypothetical protein
MDKSLIHFFDYTIKANLILLMNDTNSNLIVPLCLLNQEEFVQDNNVIAIYSKALSFILVDLFHYEK